MAASLSLYNSLRSTPRPLHHVLINDCTLLEGVQGAGITLTRATAVRLAQSLAAAGVSNVQIGMPGRSEPDRVAIEAVRDAGVPVTIEGMATTYKATWPGEVERAARAALDILHLFHAASARRLEAIGMTHDEMLAHAVQSIQHARTLGPAVVFTPTDTTHVDPAFLVDLAVAVQEAGVARIGIADTAGCADPNGMRTVTETVRTAVTVPIQTHCHNDLGLALANTLASIEAGASITDVTVLGLGERAGNAALDEVAVALGLLYGIDTGVKLNRLTRLAAEVAEILDVPLPAMKPLVGPRAFRHQFGIHAREPGAFEPIPPETVGNIRRIGDTSS